MATTTAFSSLSVPAPEDNMEMSSPAIRNLDDDIDIDFDDYQGGVHVTDDDHMLEDADPARTAASADDMMDDDILPGEQVQLEEEVMQDDGVQVAAPQQEEDEELIDYGEEDFLDQPLEEEAAVPSVGEGLTEADIAVERVDEDIVRVPDDVTTPVSGQLAVEEAVVVSEQLEEPSGNGEDVPSPLPHVTETVPSEDFHDDRTHESDIVAAVESEDQDHVEEGQPAISVDTSASVSNDTPGTPTDTGLHPMTVRYGSLHIPLFKSRRQPEGLLKDDNLANLSLAELIKNCRQRLAIKTGEDISEDQELLLGFDSMGLMLVEDSRAAFECSLNDVLEVYLQLHENDGSQDIPPLPLTLSLQLKFASSFSILKQAAAGGQGMSSFGFLQTAGHEDYDDEYEDKTPEAHGQYHGHDFQEQFEQTGYEEHADHTGEDQEHDHDAAASEEHGHDEYYQDQQDYYEETAAQDSTADEDEASQVHQGGTDGDHDPSADATNSAPEELTENNITEELVPPLQDVPRLNESASAASSTTVQGDLADGSAERTADGQDDFSTLLTEYEDPEATVPEEDQRALETPQNAAQVDLGSEDFLNDLGDREGHDIQHLEEGTIEQDEAGEDDGDYYDEADTYDEQHQEEYHSDYQPGEDDEEFHTAQNFLEGDFYEHGPEHDVQDDEEGLDETVETVVIHREDEHAEDEAQEDFEDDLGFEEELEQQESPELQQPATNNNKMGSPLGKRSFDELVGEFDDDEPELKKARSS